MIKRVSIAAVTAGLLLVLVSLFINKGVSDLYLKTFGGITAFCGLLGWIFHKKITKWLSLKTSALALAISIAVSLGIHSGISLLSCYFLTNPSRHPIRFPASACLALVCLAGLIILLYAYYKIRSKEKSLPGVILDILLGLAYCLPFYFLWITADNIISYLI